MTNADKRSVHTDALATLGTIIGPNEKRDAIHLAVEPAIAGERLFPGEHVVIRDGEAYVVQGDNGIGIVDPFISRETKIEAGTRFWLVVYPRTIQSLRHVWTHPSFPACELMESTSVSVDERRAASVAWLKSFAKEVDCPGYNNIMTALEGGHIGDDYSYELDDECFHFSGLDAHGDIPGEFWDHIEIVTGKKFPRATYFSCSC